MRHPVLLCFVFLSVLGATARQSSAQGLLHKHRQIAGPGMGTIGSLPARAAPIAVTATVDAATADAAAVAITALPANPSCPGAVGGAPGMPSIAIMPPQPLDGVPIDALPMPLPMCDGVPPAASVDYPGVDVGFDPGTVFVGGWPVDRAPPPAMAPGGGLGAAPHGTKHPFGGPPMIGHGAGHARGNASAAMAMQANSFGPETRDPAGAAGRAVAAGLPGRAIGLRPGAVAGPGRSPAPPLSRPASGPAAASSSDAPRHSGVIQAGGGTHQDVAARDGVAATIPAGGPPATAAATPPRWRDRLRVAWPTSK